MKRITSYEQLYKFEQERGNTAVADGFVEQDDQAWWFNNWAHEMKQFWDDRKVVEMLVLEGDEIEDEQYGLVKFAGSGKYEMVYMCYYSGCSGSVIFMVSDD